MAQTDCQKDDGTLSHSADASQVDDNELVKQVCMGETQLFRLLIERHQQHIFNLCYRMLRQFEEADDATQDTFLKAYRSLKRFRGDARLKNVAMSNCSERVP